ncbi:MAG: GntR family transcriptional regulator [Rhizobiaceae bacterium]
MVQELKGKSQSLRAVDDIRSLIFSGELPAGSDHLETELAERLGMSRTPVREATLVLEAQGLLEVRPRRGIRVSALSVNDMREIYEVLTELESLAAFQAAEAQYSREKLSGLAESIKKMEASLKNNDRERWAQADEDFHEELVRLGGNSRIISIVTNFNDQVRRAKSITLYLRPMPTKSNKDHRALYDAIAKADGETARKLHWRHRTETKELLTELLEKNGLRRV